jgi:DNA-binding NtrC family response regulator
VIERAVVLGAGPQVTLQDLPPALGEAPPLLASSAAPPRSYHDAVAAFQRALLQQPLAQAQGHQTAAAQALGLQRIYFQRLLTSLGLRSP